MSLPDDILATYCINCARLDPTPANSGKFDWKNKNNFSPYASKAKRLALFCFVVSGL